MFVVSKIMAQIIFFLPYTFRYLYYYYSFILLVSSISLNKLWITRFLQVLCKYHCKYYLCFFSSAGIFNTHCFKLRNERRLTWSRKIIILKHIKLRQIQWDILILFFRIIRLQSDPRTKIAWCSVLLHFKF